MLLQIGGVLTPLVVGLVAGVAGQGAGTLTGRQRFPRIGAGSIGRAVDIIRGLRARGLRPATGTGPFGNLVVGTEDQDLQLLGEEAAIRRVTDQAVTELLAEDPLFWIRFLPPGDPRRVAVGLDPPDLPARVAPSPGSPESTPTTTSNLRLVRSLPTTARSRPRLFRRGRAFSTRAFSGRFAVR